MFKKSRRTCSEGDEAELMHGAVPAQEQLPGALRPVAIQTPQKLGILRFSGA
jgi:hypothetical protein